MSKDDVIETEGRVIECLPNANFKVRLANGHIIIVARKNHAFCKQTQFVAVSNLREVNLRNYIICGRLARYYGLYFGEAAP